MTRVFLAVAGLLGACTEPAVHELPGAAARHREAPPPEMRAYEPADSVVLVTVDTLRADALGVHGGAASTPVLDAMARGGWDFVSCYSAAMLTNPSHASIMTSLYPRDHGVYDNESGLHDEARTLATALSRHGLRTIAVIGFPHLNPEVSGLGHGFDRVVRGERAERRASATTAAALAALDETAPRGPFFLWVHYTDPHAPYEPPAGAPLPALARVTPLSRAARVAPGFQRSNPWFREVFRRERFVEDLVARYHGEVAATDHALGGLLAGLKHRGRLARTAVIVTSDHGENLGEHELYFHHGGLYRESVHVPLLVAAPGLEPARVEGLVETVDIAPTALELVGAARWEPMRGRSLVAIARGLAPGREVVLSEHLGAQLAAVRSRDATFILHRKSSAQFPSYPLVSGREESYDRVDDPAETRPLGPDHARVAGLAAQLARLLGGGVEVAARRSTAVDRVSLQALGYVE